MHNIYYLGLSGEHRCPLGYLFKVFTIYGHGGHLGHVTKIMLTNFHFLVPESFHSKFSLEWPSSF